jgi:hypothetical protein
MSEAYYKELKRAIVQVKARYRLKEAPRSMAKGAPKESASANLKTLWVQGVDNLLYAAVKYNNKKAYWVPYMAILAKATLKPAVQRARKIKSASKPKPKSKSKSKYVTARASPSKKKKSATKKKKSPSKRKSPTKRRPDGSKVPKGRKAPAHHARDCKQLVRKGLDGHYWRSLPNADGVYRWVKITKTATKPKPRSKSKLIKTKSKKTKTKSKSRGRIYKLLKKLRIY